jgi:hypothetical protein
LSTEAEIDAAWKRRESLIEASARAYHELETAENARYNEAVAKSCALMESGKMAPEVFDEACNIAWEMRQDALGPSGSAHHALTLSTMADYEKIRDAGLDK